MIEEFNQAQKEVRRDLAEFNDKMANHSIATISLSVPFVGFLSSKVAEGVVNFRECFIGIPLYLFLFAGWFCLAATLIFGVSFRKRVADYESSVAKALLLKRLETQSDQRPSKTQEESEKLFKPIAQSNQFLLFFFVLGIFLILFFVAGSTVQLLKIE